MLFTSAFIESLIALMLFLLYFQILAVVSTIWQIIDEIREYFRSQQSHKVSILYIYNLFEMLVTLKVDK